MDRSIAGLARANPADVERAWEAVRDAERPRIHTFVSTSDIHIVHQLQATREDVKGLARASVAQAKGYCDDVEFSPDGRHARRPRLHGRGASRSRIDEGATTINIPDTVGYAMPQEYAAFLTGLYERVPGLRDVVLSVHCHDDLGPGGGQLLRRRAWPARARSSARSTASASAPATRRSRRS